MAKPALSIKPEEIIPPYYDRYLDEREKRFVTEIEGIKLEIRVNTQRLDTRIEDTNKRIDDTNKRIEDTNKRIDELREYVVMRFDETNKRIDELREYVVMRFDETNKRIDETNKRIEDINKRIEDINKRIEETNKRVDETKEGLSKKIDHHFYWTIGLFAPLVLSIIGGIIAILFRHF